MWMLVLFTTNIGICASGELAMLKMTERGLQRSSMALLSSVLTPIRILLPIFAERFTSTKTLKIWYGCRVYMVISSCATPLIGIAPDYSKPTYQIFERFSSQLISVYFMPKMVLGGYAILILTILGTIDEVFATLEFVTVMSFHAQVSDPILGGVYMTVLNSAANFGGMWPESLILWVTGKLGENPIDIEHPFNRSLILNGTQDLGIRFHMTQCIMQH